ncbi:MAG: tetratricopeptide repeat protein [Candidatus Doudnabacteria bacterium]|nr:tetratricopeptide repeat protein [Candidatus Doudnabacteria bacterium]
MHLFLWLVLIFSAAGIAAFFLSKIPEVAGRPVKVTISGHESMFSYLALKLRLIGAKAWHFILEAKDLTPPVKTSITSQMEKVRQVFRVRIRRSEQDQEWMPEVAEVAESNENIFLLAIKKNPTDKSAYEGLGRLYLQEKNFTEAGEIFRYLAKIDPDKDTNHSNLGLILYSLQKYPEAVVEYEKALSINGKIPARWINLSLCFIASGDYGKAIRAINNAISLDERNINYLNLLSEIYLKAGNKMRAEEVLEQILQLEPTNRITREKLMRLKI